MAYEGKNNRRPGRGRPQNEFEQRIIDLARVTRVQKGGKRLRFRILLALGDKNGKVGYAIAKGADVSIAVNKAVNKAKKNMITVKLVNETIPHAITVKYKAATVLLKPAVPGKGIVAGGAVRSILELAGVPNIYGKILSKTNNKISNVRSVFYALEQLNKRVKDVPVKKEKEVKRTDKPVAEVKKEDKKSTESKK